MTAQKAHSSRWYVNQRPIRTDAYAVFEDSQALRDRFTHVSRFEETFLNYRPLPGGKIAVPRNCAPVSEHDHRTVGEPIKLEDHFVPRSVDQEDFVDSMVDQMEAGRSFVARAMTGFGKSVCAAAAVARYGRKALIVVTKEDLRDNWIADICKVCNLQPSDIGLIQGETFETDRPVVLAMIHTLAKDRIDQRLLADFGLAVWDEVHRVGADYFANSAWKVPALVRVGLSATPHRKDGRDVVIRTHIGPTLVKADLNTMVPRVLRYKTGFKLPRRKVPVGNRMEARPIPHQAGRTGHITKMMAGSYKRNRLICDFVERAYLKGRHTIVFADTLKHLERLRTMLHDYQVQTKDIALYVGGMSEAERQAAKHKHVLLATYAYTSEGTDIPWLDTAVLATPRSDVEQIIGRIRREHPDKRRPIVLDLVDTDSPVFRKFADKRDKLYKRIEAEVVDMHA